MTTHVRASFDEVSPRPARWRDAFGRHWKGLLAAALVVLLLAGVKLWPGREAAERRALLGMGREERRALYDEALRNANAVCAQVPRAPGLFDRCASSTRFLLAFPECDAPCRAFADAHRLAPTR